MEIKLLDCTTDPLYIIGKCARTCYQSEDKNLPNVREDFYRGLIKREHEAPLEFVWTIWEVNGISRACAAQLMRHRLASYCMESQRYCNASEKEFVYPFKALEADDSCVDFVRKCKDFYKKLIELGVPREDARYFLPIGISCNLKMGMNLRQIRNFMKLRLDKSAQWEIRLMAKEMHDIISEKWPVLLEDIKND